MKVLVAMSGGVDSSVAAHLLKKQGHDVTGISFQLWDRRDLRDKNTCCSIETIEIAKAVARRIGIEHYTIDVRDAFYRYVIEEFCDSYISGLTPNPCILCNKHIKFDFLLIKARELGAEMIATGHYARIWTTDNRRHRQQRTEDRQQTSDKRHQTSDKRQKTKDKRQKTSDRDRVLLMKGIDQRKDQSYFLYVMTRGQLSRSIFPLGELTKEKTRQISKEAGLEAELRPESQEICFVGNSDYGDFIRQINEEVVREGPIINVSGEVIGTHKGIAFYTIGQRRGLDIPSTGPLYVVDIKPETNRIVVGSRKDAFKNVFKVRELNWISINYLSEPMRVSVKIRSTMKGIPGVISPLDDGRVLIEFDEPQWAPAPGQSAVFYNGDVVVGGGVIE